MGLFSMLGGRNREQSFDPALYEKKIDEMGMKVNGFLAHPEKATPEDLPILREYKNFIMRSAITEHKNYLEYRSPHADLSTDDTFSKDKGHIAQKIQELIDLLKSKAN